MLELPPTSWLIVALGAMMIGFAKTGVPGTGILVVPLMASVIPAKQSTGFVLPMLAMADILAILYWRRHVVWIQLLHLLPWALVGVVLGSIGMHHITDRQLQPIIGVIILLLIAGTWLRQRLVLDDRIPGHWAFAAGTGILAGTVSMMANAAGPIMIIYLLAKRFNKERFIGTQAWFFWILNLSKLPFSSKLGLVTSQSLLTNMALLPVITGGGFLGIYLVHRISQRTFNTIIQALAIIAALRLCIINL